MIASAFPLAQPARLTTSWITGLRSGVRWSEPACPTVAHAFGDQVAVATVRGREEMFLVLLLNVAALSAACPFRLSVVAPLAAWAVVNCTHAAVIVAPGGMARPVQRTPTVLAPNESVEPVNETLPVLVFSRASSDEVATRLSSAAFNVKLEVTGADLRPPVSVTVSVTVYVPAAA